jgi:hypothetical protein
MINNYDFLLGPATASYSMLATIPISFFTAAMLRHIIVSMLHGFGVVCGSIIWAAKEMARQQLSQLQIFYTQSLPLTK